MSQSETQTQSQSPVSATERTKQIKLTTKGLENAALLGINDFVIRFGSEKFACSRFEAAFISPQITTLLLQYPTIDEYEIKFEFEFEGGGDAQQDWESSCLTNLISLSRNGLFELNESNFDFVKRIAKNLGNLELCESLKQFGTEGEEINSSNIIERLSLCEFLDVCDSDEIDYLSSHFYELDGNVLRKVSHDCLKRILGSEGLRLSSEDSLVDLIIELGTEYFDLLCCIQTEYLSRKGMSRLLESISRYDISEYLWGSLCRRLLLIDGSESLPDSRFVMNAFGLESRESFKGIISHLSSQCGGNVHTHEIVSITASSNGRNSCHQVVDYDWTDYWYSNNAANSWIQFDFKTRRISPTHYTIKSDGNNGYHLLKWSLDGSNDGTSWINLDRRDTNDLNGPRIVKTYECGSNESSNSFFRFIRLTQTGKDSNGYDYLHLGNLEFHGKLNECQSV
jgi:hypothetical protein